jgi:hypothetical protein
MSIYDKATSAAEQARAKFGLDAVLRRVSSTKSRATGKGSQSITEFPVSVAAIEVEVTSELGLTSMAAAFYIWTECKINDLILFAGKSYKIEAVDEFAPAGAGLYWIAKVGSGA